MTYLTARTITISYAVVTFVFLALNVATWLMDPSPPWRRVITWSAIAVLAPLVPYAGLKLGAGMARTDLGRAVAIWASVAAVGVAVLMAVTIAFSAEPLAALAMLYVPPLQVVLFLAAFGLIWIKGRA